MTLSWRVQKTWLEDGGHKSYIFTINFWEWGKSQQVQYIVERKQQTSFRIGKNIVLKKFIDLDLFKWPHFHWIYSRKICQKIDPWIRVNFRGSTFEKGPPPSLGLIQMGQMLLTVGSAVKFQTTVVTIAYTFLMKI